MDLYLKADSQEAMDAMLLSVGLIDDDGEPTQGIDLDRIGEISRVKGYGEDGEPIIKTYDGYHANVRTAQDFDESLLNEFLVIPLGTPFRVWG
jgi:hypothetical protein